MSRVELITDSIAMREARAIVEQLGVPGWSILPDVEGSGGRGWQGGDELSGACRNACLLAACEPALAERLAEALRPLLRRHGGICLLSEARAVRH